LTAAPLPPPNSSLRRRISPFHQSPPSAVMSGSPAQASGSRGRLHSMRGQLLSRLMRVSPAQHGVSVPAVKRVLPVNQMILARASSRRRIGGGLALGDISPISNHPACVLSRGIVTTYGLHPGRKAEDYQLLPPSVLTRTQKPTFPLLPEEDEAGEHDRRGPVSVRLQVRSSASKMYEAPSHSELQVH
jgi:hypothetical protein